MLYTDSNADGKEAHCSAHSDRRDALPIDVCRECQSGGEEKGRIRERDDVNQGIRLTGSLLHCDLPHESV